MELIKKIESMNDEELKKMVQERIKKLEGKSKKENPKVSIIGYEVENSPTQFQLKEHEDSVCFELVLHCFYNNYIPKGTKIIYCISYNMLGIAGNHGNYYYMDNDDYIYDFCKFIQDKEIENEYELFDYMLEFIRNYFGYIKDIDRYTMNALIAKNEKEFFPAIKEHSITNFKGKGNALCTEYAVMAQNLMRFMGLESFIIMGNEQTGDYDSGGHAFNMVSFKNSETGEQKNVLIDFSKYINIFDFNFNKIGECPFMGELDIIDEDLVREVVYNDKHLVFEDYSYYILGDSLSKIGYYRNRDYFVDTTIHADKDVKGSKTYTLK